MASADYDWFCQEDGCGFRTRHYRGYPTWTTDRKGKRHRSFVLTGTVMFHQDETGHQNFKRKTAPGV